MTSSTWAKIGRVVGSINPVQWAATVYGRFGNEGILLWLGAFLIVGGVFWWFGIQQHQKDAQTVAASADSGEKSPAAFAQPQPPPARIYVDKRADELMDMVDDLTSIEIDRLVKPYIGKWLTVGGRVRNVSDSYGG